MGGQPKIGLGIIGWILFFVGCLLHFSNSIVGLPILIAGIVFILKNVRRGSRVERIWGRVGTIGGCTFIGSFCMQSQSPLTVSDGGFSDFTMLSGLALFITSETIIFLKNRKD